MLNLPVLPLIWAYELVNSVTVEESRFLNIDSGRLEVGEQGYNIRIPWQVFITAFGWDYFSGSIITERWVITAAHKVSSLEPSDIEVIAGLYNITYENGWEQYFNVDEIVTHWQFIIHNDGTIHYDIGLLKLSRKVTFNNFVKAIKLADRYSDPHPHPTNDTIAGTDCITSGWGKSKGRLHDILQVMKVNVENSPRCRKPYLYTLCVRGLSGNTQICQGDQGGPLACRYKSSWVLFGVISWGYKCSGSVHATVFARISFFLPMIQKVVGIFDWDTKELPITDDEKIVGQKNAEKGSFPWQISIGRVNRTGQYKHSCGGAIINAHWILTAAYCVHPRPDQRSFVDLILVAGEHDMTIEDGTEQRFNISKIIIHEDFYRTEHSKDVALLKIDGEFKYNTNVKAIPLASSGQNRNIERNDQMHCVTSGWGRIDINDESRYAILQAAVMRILSMKTCVDTFYSSAYSPDVKEDMLCAGYIDGNRGACMGDSGGPLICKLEEDKWTLVGIVSWAEDCIKLSYPQLFMRVSYFYDWINEKIKLN